MRTGAENDDGQHGGNMALLVYGFGCDARHAANVLRIIKEDLPWATLLEDTAGVIQAMQNFALLMTSESCAFKSYQKTCRLGTPVLGFCKPVSLTGWCIFAAVVREVSKWIRAAPRGQIGAW